MKTILYLMIALFMSANITSCNPTSIAEDELIEQQANDCCDEDEDILPPPPPPPPTGDGN